MVVIVLTVSVALPRPGPLTALFVAVVAFAVGLSRNGVRPGAAVLALLVLTSAVGSVIDGHPWQGVADELLFALLRFGVPWLIGVAWRLRTQVRRQARERADQQRRQRRAAIREERDAERLALTEALHDDLGRALSLVALSLGRLEIDPTLEPPTRDSVTGARRELSLAVERLGASVTSLRKGATPGVPPREDIAALLDQACRAGAELEIGGLPASDQLSGVDQELLARAFQEGLTNAVKHAPDQPIGIDITETGTGLRVTVNNRLADPPPAPNGSGTGLVTLDRRLRAHGGRLEARAGEGEFLFRALVPHRRTPRSDPADTVAPNDDEQDSVLMAKAGMRGRAILAAAVFVIVAGLGTVEAVVTADTRRALLPVEDYAQIHVGDSRDHAQQLLPDHTLPSAPASTRTPGCYDYAVTVNTFEDAFGDAYRICFTDDVVLSTEYISARTR